jgi:hypothetical protein
MSDVTAKVTTAKEKKQIGDEAFKEGRIQAGTISLFNRPIRF